MFLRQVEANWEKDLFNESNLKEALDIKEKENMELKNKLESMTMFIQILELDLVHKETYPWNEEAFGKLSQDNKLLLKNYEHALVLKNMNAINEEDFIKFSKKSGLWSALYAYEIALYNYEKMRRPVSQYSPPKPKIQFPLCGSCGFAIINGYCKCSN